MTTSPVTPASLSQWEMMSTQLASVTHAPPHTSSITERISAPASNLKLKYSSSFTFVPGFSSRFIRADEGTEMETNISNCQAQASPSPNPPVPNKALQVVNKSSWHHWHTICVIQGLTLSTASLVLSSTKNHLTLWHLNLQSLLREKHQR